MTETTSVEFQFTVRTSLDAPPWIALEPLSGTLPILQKGSIGFDLYEGTTKEQADEIVDALNDNVESVSYTGD